MQKKKEIKYELKKWTLKKNLRFDKKKKKFKKLTISKSVFNYNFQNFRNEDNV